MASSNAAFVDQYVLELRDLTFNSKPIINTLTMLASENRVAAPGIAEAISQHIQQCAPPSKLPALYLLDSIVKNVGLPYTALFASDIPEIYMAVWSSCPESRPSLQRLLGTWQKLFPQDILVRVGQLLTAAQITPHNSSRQTTSQRQPQYVPQQQQSLRPHQNRHQHMMPVHQQGYQSGSQTGFPSRHSPAYVGTAQQHFPAQQFASANTQYPAQNFELPPPPSPPQNMYASAYTPTYPQPQIGVGPSMSPQRVQPTNAIQNVPSSGNRPALPAFLAQLLNSGVITATGNPIGGNQTPPAPRTFEGFNHQEVVSAAIRNLKDGSKASKPKFLDIYISKKRRLANGVKESRQWYVKEGDWLAGTTASTEAVPAFFDEPEQAKPAEDEEESSVPADPDQPNCALSGERFESFWDDARNEWRYQGAAALTPEQALKYGLKEGQLVKLSCLAPTVASGLNTVEETLEVAANQKVAEEIEAANLEDPDPPNAVASDNKDDIGSQDLNGELVEGPQAKRLKAS